MRKMLFMLLAAASLAVVTGCMGEEDDAGTAFAPSSQPAGGEATIETSEERSSTVRGWIAFRSGSEIVAIDPADPSETLVLALSRGADPIAWSSDGTKLLLRLAGDEGWPGLFVLGLDGTRTTLVPESYPSRWCELPVDCGPPTWGSFSPDGTQVAYAGTGTSRGPYIVDADGGRPRPLGDRCELVDVQGRAFEVCGEGLPEAAAWSPDGSRIAWYDFVEDSAKYGHHAGVLSFVNPDGTGLREEVARLPGEGAVSLVWSPDGSRLAFASGEVAGQIFVVNADGSGVRQITDGGENRWPAWSPEGSRIAFVRNGTLATMRADGTDIQPLPGITPDGAIAWNPAG